MASATTKLLADAFSASLNASVYTYEDYCKEKDKRGGELYSETLDILKLFELSYLSGPFGDTSVVPAVPDSTDTEFCIKVKNMIGKVFSISFHGSLTRTKVEDLKCRIEAQAGIPFLHQRLIFGSQSLEDGFTLSSYDVHDQAIVYIVIRPDTAGASSEVFHIDPKLLHPEYDYDFTSQLDTGVKFVRGGFTYYRPYGWKRIALRVLDSYEDSTWLGSSGNKEGEWPVSYHGTAKTHKGNIAKVGYELSKGREFTFGKGVYCTPFVDVAAKYAQEFTHDGKRYQMVLQSRVSPKNLKIITEKSSGDGEYWLQPQQDLIRAYSICYRKV